jgi:hypothetical protein
MISPTQQYLLRMNDGRQFTDYTPRGSMPLPADGLPAHKAKNQMISDADAIIARDRQTAAASVGGTFDAPAQLVDVPGFEVTQMCDVRSCSFASAEPVPDAPDQTGLGISRSVTGGPS